MDVKNIDYLSFSVDIEYYDRMKDSELFRNLEKAKRSTAESGVNGQEKRADMDIRDMCFEVLGNGCPGFMYILHNSEYQVWIAKYRSKHDDYYPVMVRIMSESLWAYGSMGAYKRICDWIEKVFGKIIKNKISRVDMACHTDVFEFDMQDMKKFKGRYRKSNVWMNNRVCTGLEFGVRTADIFCRIYNKTKEVTEKLNKEWYFEIWDVAGMNLSNVWNIEFELKRNYFKECHIESVEDFFDHMTSIWRYLTQEWLQYVVNDHKRLRKCTVDKRWVGLSEEYGGTGYKGLISREKQSQRSADGYIPHIMGVVTKFAAFFGITDYGELMQLLFDRSNLYYKKRDVTMEDEIKRKRKLMGYSLIEKVPEQLKNFGYVGTMPILKGEYGNW